MLIIRLRTLLGALPRAVDGLVDEAFGPWAPRARRGAAVVAALLAVALVVVGLALAPSEFSDFSAYLPWAVGAIAIGSLLVVIVAARRSTDPRPSVVPALIGLLLVISAVPAVQAGAELIVTRTSAGDFVDRLTGSDVSLLEVQALALGVPFEAGTDDRGEPSWFYAVRDDLSDERVALIRSPVPPGDFETRSVVARVLVDPDVVAGATQALDRHGWRPQGLAAGTDHYLAEATSPEGSVRSTRSASEIADLDAGTLVRIELRFSGTGIARCEADQGAQGGIGADCDVRRLATGTGGFVQVAHDGDGVPLLVQTGFPASDMPIHVVGRQVRAERELASFLSLPWVNRLLGWANVLPFAYLDHDPRLQVDHLWLAPVLFLVFAALLWLGRRLGYPTFVLEPRAASGAGEGPRSEPAGWRETEAVRGLVSGRLARPHGGPLDLDDAPGELRPPSAGSGGGAVLMVDDPHGPRFEITLPAGAGALTNLDRGTVHYLTARRPALWLHWFGSDARLVFRDASQRDRAEALLVRLRDAPARPGVRRTAR